MRYIQNVELREWVKESLRKTIFQKAHALSIQTGCEILVKLHDDTDVSSHQYYATGNLHKAYNNNNLHKNPKDKLVSGDTGLPLIDYVDQAVQSEYASDEHLSEADAGQLPNFDTSTTNFDTSTTNFDTSTEEQNQFDIKDEQTILPLHLTVSNDPPCGESETTKETSEGDISNDNGQLPEGVQIKVEKEDDQSEGTCMLSETLETSTQSTETETYPHFQDDLPMDTAGSVSTDSLQVEQPSVGTITMPMSPKPYQCAMCGKAFRSVQVLQKHTQTFHFRGQGSTGLSRGRGRGYASSFKRYQCVMCSRSFPHPDLLQDHMTRSHMGRDSSATQQLSSQTQPSVMYPPNSSAGTPSQGPFHLTDSHDQSQPSTSGGVLPQSWSMPPSSSTFTTQKRKIGGLSSYKFPHPGRPGSGPLHVGPGAKSPKIRGPVPMPALKTAILLTAGPVGSYSAFLQSGPRTLKSTVTRNQYLDATEQLVNLQIAINLSNEKPYGRAQVTFVKKPPDQVKEVLEAHTELCDYRDYSERYMLPVPKNVNISEDMKQEILEKRYLLSTHENQLRNKPPPDKRAPGNIYPMVLNF